VVFIIALGKLVDVAFSLNSEILVFSSYYRFNLLLTVCMSGLLIAANYYLIPVLGIEGAALGSAAVMLAYNVVKYGYLKWKLNLDPFSVETLKILVVGVGTVSALYLSPALTNPFLSILTTSLLVIGVFVGSSALFGVGKEEWAWLKNRGK
jgi:O-antigen/teichoic acid export membrane protein